MEKKDKSCVIVSSKATIRDAIEAIVKNGLLGVFVCDGDGELIGIVMDSDIRVQDFLLPCKKIQQEFQLHS